MRRVIGFIFRPTPQEESLARLWLDIGTPDSLLYTIPQTKPEDIVKNGDIVVTFGTTTRLIVQSALEKLKDVKHIALPPINKLENKATCTLARTEAKAQLDEIAILKEVQLGEIPIEIELSELPQEINWKWIFHSDQKTRYYTSTKGRRIQINGEPTADIDVYLTLPELLTISKIMETLNVKEVRLDRPIKEDKPL
jgi:hypothetical protein